MSGDAVAFNPQDRFGEPDLSFLDETRAALPEFPEAVLAPAVRDTLARAATGAGVTFAHVAVPLIAIASALIGAARCVQASRSYSQPSTLWVALVGWSGSGKTPGITVTTRALAEIQRIMNGRLGELQRRHETKAEAAKAAFARWQKAVEEAVANGWPCPVQPAEAADVGRFVAPRLSVSDATIERLAELVGARPSGLAVIADELAGLFANMNRYSHGSDREFWLEAWNGHPYTVERMGRRVALEHLLVGVTGGFQPDKMRTALERDDDGMGARFLFAWPSEVGYRPLSDDADPIEPELLNALGRLARLGETAADDVFATRKLPLSEQARARFEAFRKLRSATLDGVVGREREWWSKSDAKVLRLAGTLAMLEWAWHGADEPAEISLKLLEAAVTLFQDYFWPHSRAALRHIASKHRHVHERRVLAWLRKTPRDVLAVEDVRRSLFGGSIDAADTAALLERLTAAGWLRYSEQKTASGAGRPARRWMVNPALHAAGENG